MIAFDTNLLVRIAVNDDHRQAEIAEQLKFYKSMDRLN